MKITILFYRKSWIEYQKRQFSFSLSLWMMSKFWLDAFLKVLRPNSLKIFQTRWRDKGKCSAKLEISLKQWMESLCSASDSKEQKCGIVLQSGSYWPQMGHIREFFSSDVSTFWLAEPKCSEIWSEKVPDLSHIGPI